MSLSGRRILVGMTGGIAAYKTCAVLSALAKQGAEVRAVLTEGARRFVTPLTVSTLCRRSAHTDADFWAGDRPRPLHIELAEGTEILAIAPLSANTLAKLALGLADNLLTNTVLAANCPILLAPAMNTQMWAQPVVRSHWQTLRSQPRYRTLEPESGILACDAVGAGRMAEPEQIVAEIESILACGGRRDLTGKHLLVSAGATREYLDPVRFLSNPSTGKMGVAIARAAATRGATVTLVGNSSEPSFLCGVEVLTATTAETLHRLLLDRFADADWTIAAAAVGDVRPATCSPTKLPKRSLPDTLPLAPVPDILMDLGARKQPHQRLVGFAAQTGDIVAPALEKLERKGLDAIVANPIDIPGAGFGSITNEAVLLTATGDRYSFSSRTKLQLAHNILDCLAEGDRSTV